MPGTRRIRIASRKSETATAENVVPRICCSRSISERTSSGNLSPTGLPLTVVYLRSDLCIALCTKYNASARRLSVGRVVLVRTCYDRGLKRDGRGLRQDHHRRAGQARWQARHQG